MASEPTPVFAGTEAQNLILNFIKNQVKTIPTGCGLYIQAFIKCFTQMETASLLADPTYETSSIKHSTFVLPIKQRYLANNPIAVKTRARYDGIAQKSQKKLVQEQRVALRHFLSKDFRLVDVIPPSHLQDFPAIHPDDEKSYDLESGLFW